MESLLVILKCEHLHTQTDGGGNLQEMDCAKGCRLRILIDGRVVPLSPRDDKCPVWTEAQIENVPVCRKGIFSPKEFGIEFQKVVSLA